MEKLNNYFLYLSGVITENQYHEGMNPVEEMPEEGMELPEFKQLMRKLAVRLGGKANDYAPLLRYVAKNKNMLEMFEELIEDVATMQASVGKRIFK